MVKAKSRVVTPKSWVVMGFEDGEGEIEGVEGRIKDGVGKIEGGEGI